MTGKGSADLLKYREGKKLTSSQSIRAKCAECMGNYEDGRKDCTNEGCPLYPWMPYGTKKRAKKQMNEETKEKLREALKIAREKKGK